MRAMRLARLLIAVSIASCAPATHSRSGVPANHDVEVTVLRAATRLPDACDVRIVNGNCHFDVSERPNELLVRCAFEPPSEKAVADVSMCVWGRDELSVLGPLACRAGGDTIVRLYAATDSCIERRADGTHGTAAAQYIVYRLRH
jgi:hypothetical protein